MFWVAADELGFSAGGQEILRLEESVGNGLEITAFGTLELEDELRDINGNAGTPGQILSSTGAGVDWIDAPTGGGTVNHDPTLTGDGSIGTPLGVSNGGINTTQIANSAVTSLKIQDFSILGADLSQMGATPNQVLKWDGAAWGPDNDADSGGHTGTPALWFLLTM